MNRFFNGIELRKTSEGLSKEILDETGRKTEEISEKDFYELIGEGNMMGNPELKVQKIKRQRIEDILKYMIGKSSLSRDEVELQLNIDLNVDSAFWALYHTGYITKNDERFSISAKGKEYLKSFN